MYTSYFHASPKACKPKASFQNAGNAAAEAKVNPRMNVLREENAIVVEFSMPGVIRENLSLHLEDRILTVKAKRVFPEGQPAYVKREFGPISYEKSLRLGEDLNADNIQARLEQGLLTIRIERKAKAQIQVEVR